VAVSVRLDYGGGFNQECTVILRKAGERWLVVEILRDEGRSLTRRLVAFASYCTG
jgi:hypothetical protein